MITTIIIGNFVEHEKILSQIALGISVISAISIAAIRLPSINRIARIFFFGAIFISTILLLLSDHSRSILWKSTVQGTEFSAFLVSLGLIRRQVRHSPVIAKATTELFNLPHRLRIAGIVFGSEFLSVLFNIGTIGIFSDMAVGHSSRQHGKTAIDENKIVLAAIQGTVLCTAWNPMGLGFAIITTSLPALNATTFLILTFIVAMLLSAALVLSEPAELSKGTITKTTSPENRKAVTLTLTGIIALIFVTAMVHQLFHVSFLVAGCLILPMSAVLWALAEPNNLNTTKTGTLDALATASATMASETTIFLSANIIGNAASFFLQAASITSAFLNTSIPDLVVILGSLLLIPVAGALLIPHSIVMITIASVLGNSPLGSAHPFSLAFALCYAWAFAVSASPVSAISIIGSKYLNVSATKMAFSINRYFTLCGLAAGAAIVTIAYLLENFLLP
ncbi:hypothetical protein [Acetobacter conturbans]|uniref:Uncharacterized protein n=1 Tax=Acetobacter conturbans TaxID=1737472 RepID=A0ABX0K1R8_9PROT|nr:hypothetical protein [Acetobacter conturbans]NHN89576.1 hypothetical protein [Acetobacter conturbans]